MEFCDSVHVQADQGERLFDVELSVAYLFLGHNFYPQCEAIGSECQPISCGILFSLGALDVLRGLSCSIPARAGGRGTSALPTECEAARERVNEL